MSDETIKPIATIVPIDADVVKTKSKPKRQRRISIIREFGLNTSTHGIPGIARSQSIYNRIFWTVSLLIFAGIMVYFVVQAIRAYFEYPSQTSVTTIVEWPQAFPAVTICNYSPLRYDTFIDPFLNYTNTLHLTNTTDTTNFTYQQSLYIRDFLSYKLNRNESLNTFFYSLNLMMMACSYNGMPCSAANFTSFISSSYGLCYTFNAKLKDAVNDGIRYNADNGGYGQLELRLYTYRNQYVPYVSYGSGMVALVHDNAEIPSIEMAGMLLGPGQHHKMSYIKKKNSFLPAPYTTCNDQVNLEMQAMFDQYEGTNYGYAQFPCFTSCIQAYTYEKCGCGNPFRWTARSITLRATNKLIDIPLCNITDPCYGPAGSEIMNTKSIWLNYCPDCRQECSTADFIIKSSSLLAPPPFLMNDIKQFVESSTVPLPVNWSTSWASEIQSNYVSLEVCYETIRTDVYSEQATLTAVDVISNVGGQTGLWIGISFLSLMEIAEMIYRLLRYQYYSARDTIRKRVETQEAPE